MNLIEYQRLVLVNALNVIACDGDIDDREVEELRRMTTATPYFDELNVEEELAAALRALSEGGPGAIDRALEDLCSAEMTDRQRLKLLEVLLRVIHADDVVREAECAYLQRAREALEVPIEVLARHFPTRFALFMPGAGSGFQAGRPFAFPDNLPDISHFLGEQDTLRQVTS
jgi:uncharacterized tellurite resistance protein B-like protein